MSDGPAPSAHEPASAYSREQLRAALWTGAGTRVHAVLDGSIVPELPTRLQAAECRGWDCLSRGALDARAAVEAAYIVELAEHAPFTDWLLHEAPEAFPGWGVLMVCARPLLAMREHARDLADVRMPDGRRRPWRWWDPEWLELLLPQLAVDQQDQIFLAGLSLVLTDRACWVWYQMRDGMLVRDARAQLRAAA